MQQSSATPKNKDVGRRLRKIVACSQPYLAVLSCIYSFWRGVIPTSYFIFNDFYTHFFPSFMHGQQHALTRIARAIDQACTRARLVKLRMCEVMRRRYSGKLLELKRSPSEGTNCLFALKDRVRTVPKRPCVIFMAFSCPSVVLGRLKKKKNKKKEKMDKIAVWLTSVYASSSVF